MMCMLIIIFSALLFTDNAEDGIPICNVGL